MPTSFTVQIARPVESFTENANHRGQDSINDSQVHEHLRWLWVVASLPQRAAHSISSTWK